MSEREAAEIALPVKLEECGPNAPPTVHDYKQQYPQRASGGRLGRVTAGQAVAPWRGSRRPATLGLLLIVAWMSSLSRLAPSPVPADAPDSVFSSGRAMIHLTEIARTACPTGSPEHTRVREYLLRQFRHLGHDPAVQTTSSGVPRMAIVRNILLRIPGSAPGGPAVLVTAHYDSAGIATGGADEGSGVVAILETVRALGTGPPLRNDLIVLITDAEELGLLGAHAFAAEHPWMDDVAVVLGIEMRDGGGPSMMFETGANNGWVITAFRRLLATRGRTRFLTRSTSGCPTTPTSRCSSGLASRG